MARKTPEIPSASMADIAFMLLIFFLVATTMDVDQGIPRVLPQPVPPNTPPPPPIHERNVFIVLLNANNQLLVEGEVMDVKQLKERTKEFILNPQEKPNLSEYKEEVLPIVGNVRMSKGVVSLQNDRGTLYGKYIEVQNELVAAYNEVRNDFSKIHFNSDFDKLTEDKQKIVRDAIPMAISEAEPRNIGGKK